MAGLARPAWIGAGGACQALERPRLQNYTGQNPRRSGGVRVILLDTNVISEPMRPNPDRECVGFGLMLKRLKTLYLSTVSLAELLFGIESLPAGKRRKASCQLPQRAGRGIVRGAHRSVRSRCGGSLRQDRHARPATRPSDRRSGCADRRDCRIAPVHRGQPRREAIYGRRRPRCINPWTAGPGDAPLRDDETS